MKRWHYTLAMIAVQAAMLGLLYWSATNHNVRGRNVADLDRVVTSAVFWITLVLPFLIGLLLSSKMVSKDLLPTWPIFEAIALAFMSLVIFGPHVFQRLYTIIIPSDLMSIFVIYVSVVVSVGLATLNTYLGILNNRWSIGLLSSLVAIGGLPILTKFHSMMLYFE